MPVNADTLADYVGKTVSVTLSGADAGEYEGKVEAASPAGMAFKPRGKSTMVINASDVEAVELPTPGEKKITVKSLKPVGLSDVRQHLVDRHGYKVADIQDNMTPEQAQKFHDELDHSELGHNHNRLEKDEKEKDEESAA